MLKFEIIIVSFTGATVLVRTAEGTAMKQRLFILLFLTGERKCLSDTWCIKQIFKLKHVKTLTFLSIERKCT